MTTFMNLNLPVPTVTLGPEWAEQLNDALDVIDAHDHSDGKGTKVKVAGIDINDDLDFQSSRATGLEATQFDSLSVSLTGTPNANSVFVNSGNLYFTNGAGVAVQLTSGSSIVAIPGNVESLQYNIVNANLSISPSDNFVYLAVDTSAARTIDLPSASAVAIGRIYMIKDATGNSEANAITVNANGADTIDGQASLSIQSNYSTTFIIGNGINGWSIS